jgi:hypothetical protein
VFCNEPSAARQVAAYLVAIALGVAAAATFYALLTRPRHGNELVRYLSRVCIIGGGVTFWGIGMRVVGGACIMAGPTRGGGFRSTPLTGNEILLYGAILGVFGGVFVPFVWKARGGSDRGLTW